MILVPVQRSIAMATHVSGDRAPTAAENRPAVHLPAHCKTRAASSTTRRGTARTVGIVTAPRHQRTSPPRTAHTG